MSTYRVFLGAPTAVDIHASKQNEDSTYPWQTVSSKQFIARTVPTTGPRVNTQSHDGIQGSLSGGGLQQQGISAGLICSQPRQFGSLKMGGTQSVVFPLATLEAASRRISLIYKDVIFDERANEEEYDSIVENERDLTGAAEDQTTLITWPPTVPEDLTGMRNTTANSDTNTTSFLLDMSKSRIHSNASPPTRLETQLETQESQSYNYSDASSIARFPSFHFALHSLTSLSSLPTTSSRGSRKVNILIAVLELEGPDTIRIKKGADAGREVAVLKMILGDEEGCISKLTAWREVAESWGGVGDVVGVKRGDVIYVESVTANWDSSTSPTLTASPYLKSRAEICYRTMPYTHEDNRLRPDLRLGDSDAAVRKVAAVARWFENLAGLTGATIGDER